MLTLTIDVPRESVTLPILGSTTSPGGEDFGRLREGLKNAPLIDSVVGFCALEDSWFFLDSSSVVLWPELQANQPDPLAAMPTADQINLVIHTLGFNKRQLGEVFGVTRQAIYDWLKGSNVSPGNRRKIVTLAQLLLEVMTDARRPLYHRYTTEPIAENEPSIFELLHRDPWDIGHLRRLLEQARQLTSERAAQETPAPSESSSAQEETNLLHNLLSLGED